MRLFGSTVTSRLVVVGELDDSDWRVAGELDEAFVRGDLEGPARVVGKVAKQWPAGQWKPLLALPGSSLLPRSKRRELERKRPDSDKEASYLEGPAVMLDVLAVFR